MTVDYYNHIENQRLLIGGGTEDHRSLHARA